MDLWDSSGGSVRCRKVPCSREFYLHLPDPDHYREMLEALESDCNARECTFRTIFGELQGYSVTGDRDVAGAIELQTGFSARLFNVDVRRDQQYLAEHGLFPCGTPDESRFSPDISWDLRQIEIRVNGNPSRSSGIPPIDLTDPACSRKEHLAGDEKTILSDLFSLIEALDPHVILFPDADLWMSRIVTRARNQGITPIISRTGLFRTMGARSYWSYGRMEHKNAAMIPDGRILIDTEQSFVYQEGGLDGVMMGSRLSGLSPNLVSRFTPGTLISSYETFEALKRGIAVPFRKSDAENVRRLAELRERDKGGMMFQPKAGVYENVHEIDFTSLYPSIIVRYNLSPETVEHQNRPGFLATVLDPLVQMRIETKRLKKQDTEYAGIDSILKWMLVTCFGYTGYRNAKFGRIEVHEAITARSRDILLQAKDIAEGMGFRVLHGIVDCLWVQGTRVPDLKARIEQETRLPTEVETCSWIAFLPMVDGKFGAYARYFCRLEDGSVKVRGIAARRHDTPEYVRNMQQEILTLMSGAATVAELRDLVNPSRAIYQRYRDTIHSADTKEFRVSRRISRISYSRRCLEASALEAYRSEGIVVAPGMKITYVVRDAKRYLVDTEWTASATDTEYYRALLDKAWEEIAFVFD
ncbi:MAG: type B DNA-directed DNA polymerase [Methanoregulaceae archaeon]